MKKDKVLYVSDLDGTLLNTRDKISDYSVEAINALVEKGMLFTYATARSLVSASVVAGGLSTRIPVIVYNGAFIIRPDTGEILSSVFFTPKERETAADFLTKEGIFPLVYAYVEGQERVSWLPEKENEGFRRYFARRKGDRRFRPLADEKKLYEGEIFYFTCIGERKELLPVYERFREDEDYICTLQQELYSTEYFCEIMPRGATKANAIGKLKQMWGCERVVSFGDAVNDIPMFRISDECYAVANAVGELKAMADGVVGDNDSDGVARWLLENAVI